MAFSLSTAGGPSDCRVHYVLHYHPIETQPLQFFILPPTDGAQTNSKMKKFNNYIFFIINRLIKNIIKHSVKKRKC